MRQRRREKEWKSRKNSLPGTWNCWDEQLKLVAKRSGRIFWEKSEPYKSNAKTWRKLTPPKSRNRRRTRSEVIMVFEWDERSYVDILRKMWSETHFWLIKISKDITMDKFGVINLALKKERNGPRNTGQCIVKNNCLVTKTVFIPNVHWQTGGHYSFQKN